MRRILYICVAIAIPIVVQSKFYLLELEAETTKPDKHTPIMPRRNKSLKNMAKFLQVIQKEGDNIMKSIGGGLQSVLDDGKNNSSSLDEDIAQALKVVSDAGNHVTKALGGEIKKALQAIAGEGGGHEDIVKSISEDVGEALKVIADKTHNAIASPLGGNIAKQLQTIADGVNGVDFNNITKSVGKDIARALNGIGRAVGKNDKELKRSIKDISKSFKIIVDSVGTDFENITQHLGRDIVKALQDTLSLTVIDNDDEINAIETTLGETSNLEETQEIASISSETETAEPGVKVQRNKMIGAPQDGTVLMIFCKYSNISFLSP